MTEEKDLNKWIKAKGIDSYTEVLILSDFATPEQKSFDCLIRFTVPPSMCSMSGPVTVSRSVLELWGVMSKKTNL